MKIEEMNLKDLDLISNQLESEYDDFWNYNMFKSELENKNSKLIVAKENSSILGFAGIWFVIDVAHITNIVVKKDLRKKGIGTALLNEIIKQCKEKNINEITLEVNEKNIAAINLYKKNGFENVGLRKKYYRTGDSAIIMTKAIIN